MTSKLARKCKSNKYHGLVDVVVALSTNEHTSMPQRLSAVAIPLSCVDISRRAKSCGQQKAIRLIRGHINCVDTVGC